MNQKGKSGLEISKINLICSMANIYEFSLFVKGGAGSILSANEMACFFVCVWKQLRI
jgi:hypothetical protein